MSESPETMNTIETYEVVYKNLSEADKQQIFELWDSILPKEVQEVRIHEVVVIAKNPEGKVVGVSTAPIIDTLIKNDPYYFLRVYVKPEYRSRVIQRDRPGFISNAKEFLRTYTGDQPKPKGVAVWLENPKITDELMIEIGMNKLPNDQSSATGPEKGKIWYYNFDGSLI